MRLTNLKFHDPEPTPADRDVVVTASITVKQSTLDQKRRGGNLAGWLGNQFKEAIDAGGSQGPTSAPSVYTEYTKFLGS